jgi:hypothetical protein
MISGNSPVDVNIEELTTAFNISWKPPIKPPFVITSYIISYKLTSESVSNEIAVSPDSRYFLLSTYPHFGREYSIEIYTRYTTGNSESVGPVYHRSSKPFVEYFL